MSALRRLVLLRHGDTVGNSRERFHGSNDVELSDEGRAQIRRSAFALRQEVIDAVVASPLRRAWQSAAIASGGAPVRLEPDFREVHFGRWEGMTAGEIEAGDPVLYRDWQDRAPGFEYPSGELRASFRERVLRGLGRLREDGCRGVLVVAHKGVIRTIAEQLLESPLEEGIPELAEAVSLTRRAGGAWQLGLRGSDPPALASG
jgi:broad specificity phosphatase PhoE